MQFTDHWCGAEIPRPSAIVVVIDHRDDYDDDDNNDNDNDNDDDNDDDWGSTDLLRCTGPTHGMRRPPAATEADARVLVRRSAVASPPTRLAAACTASARCHKADILPGSSIAVVPSLTARHAQDRTPWGGLTNGA